MTATGPDEHICYAVLGGATGRTVGHPPPAPALWGASGRLDVDTISSRQNAIVAEYRAVARGRADDDRRILLEGVHLIEEAHTAGVPILHAAIAADRIDADDERHVRLVRELTGRGTRVIRVTSSVMVALSPVRAPSGVVALAERPAVPVEDALAARPQLIVGLVDIQNPGNVGAAVRAVDAGGATALVATGTTADPYGWKALRGGMGSTFRIPVARHVDVIDLVGCMRRSGVCVLAAAARGGESVYTSDLSRPVMVLLGNEGSGLPAAVAQSVDDSISVPMRPGVESLNVAVTAALVVYEAFRQRSALTGALAGPRHATR